MYICILHTPSRLPWTYRVFLMSLSWIYRKKATLYIHERGLIFIYIYIYMYITYTESFFVDIQTCFVEYVLICHAWCLKTIKNNGFFRGFTEFFFSVYLQKKPWYRVSRMHRMPDLCRVFTAKEPHNQWLFCGKRPVI